MKAKHGLMSLAMGLGLALALLGAFGSGRAPSAAALPARPALTPAAELHVCPAGPPTCAYATIQAAVDAASPGDVIKIATGVYTGVNTYGGMNQVVYISKTLTLRGGYATADWLTSDPAARPTTLDAQNGGRVLSVIGAPLITVTIEGLRLTGGNAPGSDGGAVNAYQSTLTLRDNVIVSNTVTWMGGGVRVLNSTVTLDGNTIASNTCTSGSGGGLYMYASRANFTGNTISANTCGDGGGVYMSESSATLDGNTFTRNAGGYGGGLAMLYGAGAITLTHNTFISNTAAQNGGGLYLGCTQATIIANTFQSNTSYSGGGGLLVGCSATLHANTFTGNRTTSGGGAGAVLHSGVHDARGNTFTGNTSNAGGGGLLVYSDGGLIEANTFTGNTAFRGGGLEVASNDSVILNANLVVSNTATQNGGGVSLMGENYALHNTVIAGNRAAGLGDGLYANDASARLVHTTLARNGGGDDSAVYVDQYSTILMTNTLIYSHSLGVVSAAGGLITMTMTLWDSNITDTVGTVSTFTDITGTAALAADGYHLTAASAALNAGLEAGLTDDIDGQPRPMGGVPDIGADEYAYYADLGLTKARQGSGAVNAGALLTFTLTVSNSSTSEQAADARVVDTLSPASGVAGLRGNAQNGSCQAAGAVITCTLNNVPTGTVRTATVVVTTAGTYGGVLTNTAAVTPADAVDPQPANNSAGPITTSIVYVPPVPDLWVNKASSQRYIQPGQTLVYTLAWGNQGTLAAANTILTDTLPTGVAYRSASGNPTRNGQVLTWNLGPVAPGAGGAHTVTVQVNTGLADGALLTNTAALASATAETIKTNNTAFVTTTVYQTGGVVLNVSKQAAQADVLVEDEINYTIRVFNVGKVGAMIQLADAIPAGTEYIAATSTPAGVQYEAGGNRITWNGNLDIGRGLTITLDVKAVSCAGAECGLLRNTVEVRVPGISYVWQTNADVLVKCPDLQTALTAPPYVYDSWHTEYALTLDYRNNSLMDAWGNHSLAATPYISLTLAADAGAAHFDRAIPDPTRMVNERQWEWNLNQLNPGGAGQIQVWVSMDKYSASGYTARAGTMDRTGLAECLANLANNAAQKTTYPVEVSFGKYAGSQPNPRPTWAPAQSGEMESRFIFNYLMKYDYKNADPNPPVIESLRIDDAWPGTLTYSRHDSSQPMYFEKVTPVHLMWETFPVQFWEGSLGWVRVEGKTSRSLTPTAQVVNQSTLTYRLAGQPDQQKSGKVTDQVPLIAPFIAKPNVPGQIHMCPGQVTIAGLAQPGVKIRLFNNGNNVYTGTTDARGNFNLAGSLLVSGTHRMHATAVYAGQQSGPSNVATLKVDDTLHWDPYRSYWEGTVKAGPLQGQSMRFGFLDGNGNYATRNWQMPGVYGFWDTDMYLYTCGCPDPVHETQWITVTADGTPYTPVDWNGSLAHFRIGGAHNVNIQSRCVNNTSGQVTSSDSSGGTVLIDPDGYVFDVTKGGGYNAQTGMFAPVQAISGVTVTCMVSVPEWGGWVPWPAHAYSQTNPQVTDATYADGVRTAGYFAFFTPPGLYYLQVEGIPGYQEWRSPVVEVVTQIVHVNVPYTPWPADAGVYTVTLTPAGLSPALITVPVRSAVAWVSDIRSTDTLTDLVKWFENPVLRSRSGLDPLRDVRGWDAGMLEPGRVYRRAFRIPGRYAYTDGAGHSGVVVVEGPMIYLPIVLRH